MSRTSAVTPLPPPPIDAELKKLMRTLKLGRMLDTLPERLALAKQQSLPYADFLSLVFADEVERRDRRRPRRVDRRLWRCRWSGISVTALILVAFQLTTPTESS